MNKRKKIEEFIKGVKENYNFIICLNLLKENEKNLKNEKFKFFILSLRDTSQYMDILDLLTKENSEYEFFEMMQKKSLELSNCATQILNGSDKIEYLYQLMTEYCKYAQEWCIKASIYLK